MARASKVRIKQPEARECFEAAFKKWSDAQDKSTRRANLYEFQMELSIGLKEAVGLINGRNPQTPANITRMFKQLDYGPTNRVVWNALEELIGCAPGDLSYDVAPDAEAEPYVPISGLRANRHVVYGVADVEGHFRLLKTAAGGATRNEQIEFGADTYFSETYETWRDDNARLEYRGVVTVSQVVLSLHASHATAKIHSTVPHDESERKKVTPRGPTSWTIGSIPRFSPLEGRLAISRLCWLEGTLADGDEVALFTNEGGLDVDVSAKGAEPSSERALTEAVEGIRNRFLARLVLAGLPASVDFGAMLAKQSLSVGNDD